MFPERMRSEQAVAWRAPRPQKPLLCWARGATTRLGRGALPFTLYYNDQGGSQGVQGPHRAPGPPGPNGGLKAPRPRGAAYFLMLCFAKWRPGPPSGALSRRDGGRERQRVAGPWSSYLTPAPRTRHKSRHTTYFGSDTPEMWNQNFKIDFGGYLELMIWKVNSAFLVNFSWVPQVRDLLSQRKYCLKLLIFYFWYISLLVCFVSKNCMAFGILYNTPTSHIWELIQVSCNRIQQLWHPFNNFCNQVSNQVGNFCTFCTTIWLSTDISDQQLNLISKSVWTQPPFLGHSRSL